MPSGTASMASLRRSRAMASGSLLACWLVDEQHSSSGAPSACAISSMPLAMSTL